MEQRDPEWAASSETLEIALYKHPDAAELVINHVKVRLERMLKLPVSQVFGSQFDSFFRRVSATGIEREPLFHTIDGVDPSTSLGVAWANVRPGDDLSPTDSE